MAITYTENYHLGKQEDHTDKFDMDVITENADKIDEALSGMQSDLDAKGTYSKPSGGIPKTDLTSAVQESLNKADSAANGADFNTLLTIVAGGNTKTATGTSSITMAGTFGKPVVSYQISGKTYQNGNVSPTNPIDVQGVGDIRDNALSFPYSDSFPKTQAGVIWDVDASSHIVTASGTATGYSEYVLMNYKALSDLRLKNGDKLYFKLNGTLTNVVGDLRVCDSSKQIISGAQATGSSGSVTIPSNGVYIYFCVKRNNNGAVSGSAYPVLSRYTPIDIDTPAGTTCYKLPVGIGTTDSNIILNQPLFGNSSVQDSVEYNANDSGTKTKKWGLKVFDGTEDWLYSSAWSGEDTSVFYLNDPSMLPISYDSKDAIVSHFQTYTRNELVGNMSTEGYSQSGDSINTVAHTIRITESRASDLTAFKSWLASQYSAGTPLTVVFRLATAVTENIELPELPTAQASRIIDGATTALTVETSVAPTRITAVYKSINE